MKFTLDKTIKKWSHYAPIFLRLAFGVHLLYYSWEPVTNLSAGENAGFLKALGILFPELMSWVYMLTEFVGGIFLIIGFKVRLVAVPLIVTFIIASFVVHGGDPYQDAFQAFQMLAVSLFFFFNGAGKPSIDAYAMNKSIGNNS